MAAAEEELEENVGLKELWPVVKQTRDLLCNPEICAEDAVEIIGHRKVFSMYDKAFAKTVFALPQLVACLSRLTTLGSVVSRLLRSIGYDRKSGVAPQGFLERQLKDAFEART